MVGTDCRTWLFFETCGETEHGQIVDDVHDEGDEEEGGQGGCREGAADHEKGQNTADGGVQHEYDGVGLIGASCGRATEERECDHGKKNGDEEKRENPRI